MVSSATGRLLHPRWGPCELVRIEATDWIVRVEGTGVLYRVPPEIRSHFLPVEEDPPSPATLPAPALSAPPPSTAAAPVERPIPRSDDSRRARRAIESLRNGLPSLDGSAKHLAVGFRETERLIGGFLKDVAGDGGAALLLKGQYGQGKTFALTLLDQIARQSGFLTARTEVDATENRLNKPHHIYRDFIRNLRFPEPELQGAVGLASKVQQLLGRESTRNVYARTRWLEERLNCFPLSWLLSDSRLIEKPALIGLLECDPNYPVRIARTAHEMCPPQGPRQWPAFTAGTQGDFASFVLSGIGRLAKLLGYKGLVLTMDEMEKWTDLNWLEQSRAGNLLGGLIWGSTAEGGRHRRDDHPAVLTHSGRCGGYPFTTAPRSHVGIAIAMTPRGEEDPELLWSQYGRIEIGNVPALTRSRLSEYCRAIAPLFASAYGLTAPSETQLRTISDHALETWQRGDMTTRSGVQSAIAAFDRWRERQ